MFRLKYEQDQQQSNILMKYFVIFFNTIPDVKGKALHIKV